MKRKSGASHKICEHEIIKFLCFDKNNFRGCVKCKRSWPRPHPALSQEEVSAVIDFGIYVAQIRKERREKEEKRRARERREMQEELDLL